MTTIETLKFHSVRGRHRRRPTFLDRLTGPAAWLLDAAAVVRSAALIAFVTAFFAALVLLAANWSA